MEVIKEHKDLVKSIKNAVEAITDLIVAYHADDRREDSICPADYAEDLENISDVLDSLDGIVSQEYTRLYVRD